MNLRKNLLTSLSPLLLAVTAGPASAATILYEHTFDGGTGSISAVAPDTANTGTILGANHGTSSSNWELTGNGSFSALQNGTIIDDSVARLDFDPQNGFVYTLTATGTTQDASSWLGLGFTGAVTGANARFFGADGGIVWALKRSNAVSAHFNATGGTGGEGGDTLTNNPETFSIVLDTRDGTGLWDVSYFAAGSATPYVSLTDIGTTAANAIDRVAYSAEGGTHDIDSFSLTVAIPEPSSAMLVGLAGLMVLTRRRR
jgi:hypothetical protein